MHHILTVPKIATEDEIIRILAERHAETNHIDAIFYNSGIYRGFVIYTFQSAKYLETGNVHDQFFGNAPLALNKESGEVFVTGTAYDIEYYIDEHLDHPSQ